MRRALLLLLPLAVAGCDRFRSDSWQSYYQTLGVGVTVGASDESANSPFGGAFGDGFSYHVNHSAQYWGEDGRAVNSHYTPYSPGSATPYYRGADERGVYGAADY